MPYIAGITFTGLSAGSSVSALLLSSDEPTYKHLIKKTVGATLESTLKEIVAAFPDKIEQKVIISVPSFTREEEKEAVKTSAKAAGIPLLYIWDNLRTVQQGLATKDYPAQNELLLEIGASSATARLVSTEVDEEIRMSDVAKEIIIEDSTTADLLSQLVDPNLTLLKQIPTAAGSDLKRIVIIDHTSTSTFSEQLKSRFANEPIEVIVESDVSAPTAAATLHFYRSTLNAVWISNVAPLRVGIAKADGFVLTLIPRHYTLPQHQTVLLTTSKDDQTKASIKILVGGSPRAAENTTIADVVLEGLAPKPKGVPRIRVTIDVELEGKTRVLAEEELEGGTTGVSSSVELKDVVGNDLDADGVSAIVAKSAEVKKDEDAEKAEEVWAGEEAQGALPE